MASFFSPSDPFGQLFVYQFVTVGLGSPTNNAQFRSGGGFIVPTGDPFPSLIPVVVSDQGGSASLSGTAGLGAPFNVNASAGGSAGSGVQLQAPLVLAPVVSQAPRTVPVDLGLTVSGASPGQAGIGGIAFLSVNTGAGPFSVGLDESNGALSAPGQISAGFLFTAAIQVIAFGELSSNSVTATAPMIGGSGTVTIDGVAVPTNSVYVLRNAADFLTPLSADAYPKATIVDGFDFDPTSLLSVRGGTATARGVDEDGFGGNNDNIVEDLLVRVLNAASDLTNEDRD